jgi:hypothetical protein
MDDWMFFNPYPTGHVAAKARIRSALTWKHIQDKPFEMIVWRDGEFLDSQYVRIEGELRPRVESRPSEGNMQTYSRTMTVFGVRDHPTVADTDLKVGDRFGFNGELMVVIDVTPHSGEIQATAVKYQPGAG